MKIISEQHSDQEKSNHNYNHTFSNSSTYIPLLSPTEKLLHQEHTTTAIKY